MNSNSTFRRQPLLLLFALLTITSCSKKLTVSKSDYTQYSMDPQLPVDSAAVRYYQPYHEKMEVEMNRVVAVADVALTKPDSAETLLGNFFTDAIFAVGLKRDPSLQCAFATKGGLRRQWPKGNITVSLVYELMPFENELVVLQLNGQSMQRMFDFIAKKEGEPVAGMSLKVKDKMPVDIKIGGQPFDPNKTYTLLTYDYLADGGDEMEFLKSATSRRDLGIKAREALLEYAEGLTREGKTINTQLDGRIIKE